MDTGNLRSESKSKNLEFYCNFKISQCMYKELLDNKSLLF